jgi:hypothetical protein
LANAALPKSGGTVTGNLEIGTTGSLIFEGATADAFETTLAVVDPTADRTITLPNVTGTVVTTGDAGTVTSTMILDGTIVDADVNASAAIALSKLATGALPTAITVASANIVDGSILNADVNASAAIAGTKISPDFGSQNRTSTGTSTAASFIPTSSSAPTNGVYLPAANSVAISTNGTGRLFVSSNGQIAIGTSSFSSFVNLVAPATTAYGSLDTTTDTYGYLIFKNVGTTCGYFGPGALSAGTNLGISTEGAKALVFGTNNTERARIDSSGRLLVGTSSASGNALLQVNAQASANGNAFRASHRIADPGTAITQTGTGAPYISYLYGFSSAQTATAIAINGEDFASGLPSGLQLEFNNLRSSGAVANGDRLGRIAFGGDDATNIIPAAFITAEVDGTPGANDMPGRLVFSTTADGAATPTEAMRINNQRELLIGTTTRTANGGVLQVSNGITFPATAVACTDPNTLDDYEEGTWTPSLGGTATYTTQVGRYTKTGRVVVASFIVGINTIGTGSDTTLSGLPFTVNAATQGGGTVSYYQGINVSAVYIEPYTFNSTNIYFYGSTAAAASLSTLSVFKNSAYVQGYVIYEV